MKCDVRWLALLLAALAAPPAAPAQERLDFPALRAEMVEQEIAAAGVANERVLESMRATERHEFVPRNQRRLAYFDIALPIGDRQTISPPFVVAYMTEQLDPQPEDKVLEIGTGSGYQAAVLSPLVRDVYTIEIVESLGKKAEQTLRRLKYDNVHTRIGDGYQGWPEHAPFDKIIVTCSPEDVPQPLADQLAEGGRMIVPLGERYQQSLYLLRKENGELVREALLPTMFVPMTGEAEEGRQVLPDPANPQLVNGGFEDADSTGRQPTAWYYQRQLELVEADDAPEGQRVLAFHNAEPGRGARALQAFGIDGRKVGELEISAWSKGTNVLQGSDASELPSVALVFYDEKRGGIGQKLLGPWRGDWDWQQELTRVKVPLEAREAILRVGLHGATGEVWFDEVRVRAIARE
jgi:protein-L-isoaspartate(D-aspartate) O-methyltransferase